MVGRDISARTCRRLFASASHSDETTQQNRAEFEPFLHLPPRWAAIHAGHHIQHAGLKAPQMVDFSIDQMPTEGNIAARARRRVLGEALGKAICDG